MIVYFRQASAKLAIYSEFAKYREFEKKRHIWPIRRISKLPSYLYNSGNQRIPQNCEPAFLPLRAVRKTIGFPQVGQAGAFL